MDKIKIGQLPGLTSAPKSKTYQFKKKFISEVEYGNKIILKPFYFDYFINNLVCTYFILIFLHENDIFC